MVWIEVLLSTPILSPLFKWLGAHSTAKVKSRFRALLQERIDIRKAGECQVYEGYGYKPLAFPLELDCKALFDDISPENIRCIFLYKHVPLQEMRWERGDNWATNWTEPQVPDKLPSLGKCGITLFLNPIPLFSLWAQVEEVDRKHLLHAHEVDGTLAKLREEVIFPDASDDWGIEIRIKFNSRFGDFIVSRKLGMISAKQGWKAICQEVGAIYDRLGIKRLPSV